jgi:transcription initiation factor TFIID TATA-box-binding protein
MIVTGAKNAEDSVNASKKYVQIVMKVGFPARFSDYKLQNITATCDVGFPIRLEGLIYAHAAYATYEPELFPGLIYRMLVPKVVLLIFVSGKIVLTGAKNTDDLGTAVENIFDSLLEFRKRNLIVSAK